MAGWVVFNGIEHNFISMPRTANVFFHGDLDVISLIAMPTLTPVVRVNLQNQHRARDNQRSWRFSIEPSGEPSFWWSTTGRVPGIEVVAGAAIDSFAIAAEPFWLRTTHDVDNGADGNLVSFYWSLDPLVTAPLDVEWTLLASQLLSGVVSHVDSQARIQLGALNAGNRDLFTGRYFKAWGSGIIGGTPEYNINLRNLTQRDQESAGLNETRREARVSIHLTDLGVSGTDKRIVRN